MSERAYAHRFAALGLRFVLVAVLIGAFAAAAGFLTLWFASGPAKHDAHVRLYPVARIITMDPERPFADTIAIGGGRVLAVGRRGEVEAALVGRAFEIDRTLEHKIVMPGFIDPHIHSTLALMFDMEIVSAVAWEKSTGPTTVLRSREAFLARIAELATAGDRDEWLLTWGYHEPYHGRVRRADLDKVAGDRPVLLWQRSAHEMIFNTAALERLGFTQAGFSGQSGVDWRTGHLWEAGLFDRMDQIGPVLFKPARLLAALETMSNVIRRGGITTVGEQGFPQRSVLGELLMLHFELYRDDAPYRWALVPNAMHLVRDGQDAASAERAAEEMLGYSTDRVRIVRHVKYFSDGSIFGQMMQLREPYLDRHHGEWMMPPAKQQEILEAFWRKGWTVHVHVNGDAGVDLVLDQFEAIRRSHGAAPGQRLILEHYGFARADQHERLRELGVEVSNNAYYPFELSPIYAKFGLGHERATQISPLGGLAEASVPFSFHSDFPMAPAQPLLLASVAMNRIASDGKVWGPEQRVSLELALRAITIEGARSLGLEDEIGSIEVGKRADLTVLETDPYDVPTEEIAEIPIWGTMFEGRLHPLSASRQ